MQTNHALPMKNSPITRTGLFFGSFNPVHIGHLIIAEYIVQHTDIGEVWFILSPQNPLKETKKMLDDKERMEMLQIAVANNPSFTASGIELDMPVPSYTINTIRKLKNDYPGKQFVLLVGMDNLEGFHQWKDHREILDTIPCYVYPRHKGNAPVFEKHPNVRVIRAPQLEISSSFIRRLIAGGKTPRYMLPDKVWRHLKKKGYYRSTG